MIQDIQSNADTRAVAINRVGIRALKLPMMFKEGAAASPTVGEWDAATDLAADRRGTHMSRLVRVLHDNSRECDFASFTRLPHRLKEKLEATECFLSVRFSCFVEKTAPVSGEKGFLDSTVVFIAHHRADGVQRQLLQVAVPVTSLCPCSKAISKYGAHNQRSLVTLTVEPSVDIRALDLIAMVETGASCELFSVLKRGDERHVTEKAYDNPKFVEDILRDLAVALQRENSAAHFRVEAENFESIHNHSAYGVIQSDGFPDYLLK